MKKKYYVYQMDVVLLNILSLVILIPFILILFYLGFSFSFHLLDISLLMVFLIPYFILHELLHSLAYVIHGANFNRVVYGAYLEKGVFCCLCKQNISKKNVLISLLYPFIFIGVITFIIGLIFNIPVLVLLSIMNISGCSGDLMMFFNFLPLKNFEYAEFDNPTAFGIYSTDDYSNRKFFGLKYVETTNKLEQKDLKKVSISKASIIVLVLYFLFGLFGIITALL